MPFELHPETPPDGAPKPFTDEAWPAVRARLIAIAERVGVPIDPPRRNVNSRFALETAELVRDRAGDVASAAFHHAISRAFFVDGADITDASVVASIATPFGLDGAAVRAAWQSRRYAAAVDDSMRAAFAAGVAGVPAYGWPGTAAISGMMEPDRIVHALGRDAHRGGVVPRE